jgi:hypothetical protein
MSEQVDGVQASYDFAISPEQHVGIRWLIGAYALDLLNIKLEKNEVRQYKAITFLHSDVVQISEEQGESIIAGGIATRHLFEVSKKLGLLPNIEIDDYNWRQQKLPIHWIQPLIRSGLITGKVRRRVLLNVHHQVVSATFSNKPKVS